MKKQFYSLLLLLGYFLTHPILSQEKMTLERSVEILEEFNAKLVEVLFSDINGNLKRVAIPAKRFTDIVTNGLAIDGSSIKGLNSIEESDCLVMLDLDSLQFNPFESRFTTASVFGSIYHFDGTPHQNSPRTLLESISNDAEKKGYRLLAGAELEFFLFVHNTDKNSLTTADEKGYCDASDSSNLKFFEEELYIALSSSEINCEKIHHEVAPGQYEVVLGHSDALHLADRIIYTQHIIKTLAKKHNMFATFMPKPIADVNGSGMHIHASIQSVTGKNLFFDKDAEYFLSTEARGFVSGLLNHAREINLLFNSSPNSFKRLVPGYEAPFYLCVGNKNRSAAIRIPEVSRFNIENHNGSAVRIELRWPDSNCNPYLALSGLFYAGIEGMNTKRDLCSFVNTNLYHADKRTLDQYNIQLLPSDLEESVSLAEHSSFLKQLLGNTLHAHFITEKKEELNRYIEQVTQHDPFVISSYELENGL